jgi:hypothetical protein
MAAGYVDHLPSPRTSRLLPLVSPNGLHTVQAASSHRGLHCFDPASFTTAIHDWAERAKIAGHPERLPSSRSVTTAKLFTEHTLKEAQVRLPSLEDEETIVPFTGTKPDVDRCL